MLTIDRTKADDLDLSFVEAMKALFGGREKEIFILEGRTYDFPVISPSLLCQIPNCR